MTTEELINKEGPLAFELEYAELEAHAPVVEHEEHTEAPAHETEAERQTKKERILALYNAGLQDIAQIVRRVGARPSYVAQVLRCRTEELSKKAASSFIDHLKAQQQEAFGNQPMRRAS